MTGSGRNILFIGLNYSPEPIGIGPYSAGLCEGLAARGHRIHAVVGQPYYPEWKHDPAYRGWRKTQDEHGVRVTRVPHYVPADPTGTRRLLHHLSFAASTWPAARAASRALRPELVFTVAPSLVAVPVARQIARSARVPLWLHVQDFEVGAALATGLIGRDTLLARSAARFEHAMLHSADRISTISGPMQALLERQGIARELVPELRNWANHAAAMASADGQRLRAEWGLAGKFVALYSGNIANKQGLEVVIETAQLLRDRPDVAVVVSGEGPNRVRLEAMAQGVANLQFRDLQPPAMVGELMRMADVHLLPQLADATDLVLPSKLGNMLASGRPVIATARPGSGIALETQDCGVVIAPENPQAMAQAVVALADDPARRATLGAKGQARAAERWDREAILDRFEAAIEDLLG